MCHNHVSSALHQVRVRWAGSESLPPIAEVFSMNFAWKPSICQLIGNQEIQRTGCQLYVGGWPTKPTIEMRRDLHIFCLGHCRLFCLQAGRQHDQDWVWNCLRKVQHARKFKFAAHNLSPVATGMESAICHRAISLGISGGVGSSNQSGSKAQAAWQDRSHRLRGN